MDLLVEAIPVEVAIIRRRRIGLVAGFRSSRWRPYTYFPPTARVLLLLAYAPFLRAPDLRGGWYKLSTGIAADFHLRDKDARHRALAALERAGLIEVRRMNGKSPFIRLAPDHRAEFQHVPGPPRPRRGVTEMRIREV